MLLIWLTRRPLLHLLCRNPKNREYFYHDLHDHIHHFRSRRNLRVNLEASEKAFDPLEYVHKSVLACANVLGCLRNVVI